MRSLRLVAAVKGAGVAERTGALPGVEPASLRGRRVARVPGGRVLLLHLLPLRGEPYRPARVLHLLPLREKGTRISTRCPAADRLGGSAGARVCSARTRFQDNGSQNTRGAGSRERGSENMSRSQGWQRWSQARARLLAASTFNRVCLSGCRCRGHQGSQRCSPGDKGVARFPVRALPPLPRDWSGYLAEVAARALTSPGAPHCAGQILSGQSDVLNWAASVHSCAPGVLGADLGDPAGTLKSRGSSGLLRSSFPRFLFGLVGSRIVPAV
jgi:hypothetical protein